jgi:hypothetical protein
MARTPNPELFPKQGSPAEQLAFAAQWAMLAPSMHDAQPWRFIIHGNRLDLKIDRTRRLPDVDPDDRELVISCGAALYHLRVALRWFGIWASVEVEPECFDSDELAVVRIEGTHERTAEDERLFAAMPRRNESRAPFTHRVPPDVVQRLVAAAGDEGAWLDFADPLTKETLGGLLDDADRIQSENPLFRRELGRLMGPSDHDLAVGSPLVGVLGSNGDTEADWIMTGEALARVLLVATADGLAASFLNRPIEVPALRRRLREVIGKSGHPQLLLRIGQPTAAAAVSPQRAASEVICVT